MSIDNNNNTPREFNERPSEGRGSDQQFDALSLMKEGVNTRPTDTTKIDAQFGSLSIESQGFNSSWSQSTEQSTFRAEAAQVANVNRNNFDSVRQTMGYHVADVNNWTRPR